MVVPALDSNLVSLFERRASRKGDAAMLWRKTDGGWRPTSWRQVEQSARAVARCLAAHGIRHGDRVAIVAENRPEWCIADLGILMAGGVSVPAYTTYTADDYRYLLEHSGASALVGGGTSVEKRLREAVGGNHNLRLLIGLDGFAAAPVPKLTTLSWDEVMAAPGSSEAPTDGRVPRENDLACFIYTSGTGGRPKGVMLTHGNILANIRGVWSLLEELGIHDDVWLSFLPLSHAYEHTAGQFLPIAMEAQIYYAEGIDKLSSNLVEARPTFLTCVPRLFEVMRQRIIQGVERQGGLKAELFRRALALGQKRYDQGGQLSLVESAADLVLDRLVRSKVRQRFGGRMKAMISGGAPLNIDVAKFFVALGVPLIQGYGQTEASPVISVNRPRHNKLDTVGPAVEGVDLEIAADGEILVRGRMVMSGYWQDEQATTHTLRDGWLHTGDIGRLDDEGYLRITDRKKDIIVNSGGDNIAPQRVEGIVLLQEDIAQVVVYGDKRPHLVALLVPRAELLKSADQVAGSTDRQIKDVLAAAIKRANAQLMAIERIRRFHIVTEPFSVDNGLLTPTMKLKRNQIYAKYREKLEVLYN